MAGRKWTPEQDAQLTGLRADGFTHRRIGEIMRRSEVAISNRCQSLGLHNQEAMRRNSAVGLRRTLTERKPEIGRKIAASWTPERRADRAAAIRAINATMGWRQPSPEARRRMSKGCSDWHKKKWAWLPEKYRAEYTRLARNPRIRAARAKEIIRARIEADKGTMTAFERAMERVRQGANIIEVRPIRRPDPQFTLGGVSSI